ncbi:MAG: mandelate racemase/muconate lactonizing enzyme family protein [Clostridiales bacterium]|nr:mandelate racemase/muconate lactonizing enzyme family protein [Clostridiales bacterium]
MKILDVKTEVFKWKRAVPIQNGKHTYPTRELGVVTIVTDEGIKGVGYGYLGFVDVFKELLIGEDPLCNERLWSKMWVPKLVGRRGMTTRSLSAIDIALWDIKAKKAGMPLYQLLGGAKKTIPVYAAGGYYQQGKGLKDLEEEMTEYIESGVKAVKMKVGAADIKTDAKRVETVRRVIGPDVKLMVDANCAYSLTEAIKFARMIEEYDPYWFEEPVEPDDYDGMRELTKRSAIPIATGENEYTRYGFQDLIKRSGIRILNADVFIAGGITEFMKIAAIAQANGCEIAPHGDHTIHSHLTCAIPNSLILEYYPKRFDDVGQQIYTHQLTINSDGTISPPQVPGHGFEPNYEALEPFRIK